jgi:hypothetical protein
VVIVDMLDVPVLAVVDVGSMLVDEEDVGVLEVPLLSSSGVLTAGPHAAAPSEHTSSHERRASQVCATPQNGHSAATRCTN